MKLKGNLSATIIILYLSFIVLCACAVDAGYVITARYRAQKLTETIALYAASILKSLPEADRREEALEPVKEGFEELYSQSSSGYYDFEINEIEIRDENTSKPKVKISTRMNIPTIFLRFAGVGFAEVLQTSYALSEEKTVEGEEASLHSWIFTIPEYITDKTGNDFKIKFDKEYFAYAAIDTRDGARHWMDIGEKSDGIPVAVAVEGANLYKLEGERAFDMSIEPSLGLVKYVRVFDATADSESAEDTEEGEIAFPSIGLSKDFFGLKAYAADTANKPEFTILNSAKLIKRTHFEEDEE